MPCRPAIGFEASSFEFDLLTVVHRSLHMPTVAVNGAAVIDTRRTLLSRFKRFFRVFIVFIFSPTFVHLWRA